VRVSVKVKLERVTCVFYLLGWGEGGCRSDAPTHTAFLASQKGKRDVGTMTDQLKGDLLRIVAELAQHLGSIEDILRSESDAPLSTHSHLLVMRSTSNAIERANLLGTKVSESWASKAETVQSEGPTGGN